MIEINSIQVTYKDEKALDQVSLTIAKNSTCAVIGESGCGKTTLLYTLAGIIKPASGSIYINNEELKGIRKETSLILQEYGLLPWKSVWNNIAFPLKSRNFSKNEIKIKVESILQNLGIEQFREKLPSELSGGQKQRVAIGRALVLNPDLLLMDEASSALDAITKEYLQNLILKLYLEKQFTLVMVTHSIEEAVFLGQNIIIMSKGKIIRNIENPYFGTEDLRNTIEYYEMCLQIRKCLYEEAKVNSL